MARTPFCAMSALLQSISCTKPAPRHDRAAPRAGEWPAVVLEDRSYQVYSIRAPGPPPVYYAGPIQPQASSTPGIRPQRHCPSTFGQMAGDCVNNRITNGRYRTPLATVAHPMCTCQPLTMRYYRVGAGERSAAQHLRQWRLPSADKLQYGGALIWQFCLLYVVAV
jgi:hypothetical protein